MSRSVNYGTKISATGRTAGDGSILVEVSVEQSKLNRDSEGRTSSVAPTSNATAQSTIVCKDGKPVLLGAMQTSTGNKHTGYYILVSATEPNR